MQDQETKTAKAETLIASQARTWRRHDKAAAANKGDRTTQRAEYRARQKLREVIDTAGR